MLKKGGVIGMNRYDSKSFFEKRIDEGYNLVLLGCELRACNFVEGRKIIFNDFKELESLKSDTIRDNELYVVVVCPAKIYIYDIKKDEEAKYRLRNPWGAMEWIKAYKFLGFGKYRCYTVSGDCYTGNPRDGWTLEREAY